MKDYIDIVNDYFKVDIRDLSRQKDIRRARQVYMYCMYKSGKYTYKKIVDSVGMKQHGTTSNAIKVVEKDMIWGFDLRRDVKHLQKKINELVAINIINIEVAKKLVGFRFEYEDVKTYEDGKKIIKRIYEKTTI